MTSFNYIVEKVVWGSSNFICNNPLFYQNNHGSELGIHNLLFKNLIYASKQVESMKQTKFKIMLGKQ